MVKKFLIVNKFTIVNKILCVALTSLMQIDIIKIRLSEFSQGMYSAFTFYTEITHWSVPIFILKNDLVS